MPLQPELQLHHTDQVEQNAPNAQSGKPLKVALISCGLGNVRRGFEVSTDRWFQVLKEHPGLEVKLFCGGRQPGGSLVWNIPRDWVMNSPLAIFKPLNRRRFWEFCYGVEQISFGLFYWPDLFKFRPDVVWIKEVPFGYFLPFYRAVLGLNFKTVFANGGAFQPSTYKDFDFIQHLTQESFDEAQQRGIPVEKMTTLTNTITFNEPQESKEQIRTSFGYKPEDHVVMCVSAWNAYHKRIDYIIEEIASIDSTDIQLMLCGHPDAETAVLKELARRKLEGRVKWLSLSEKDVHRAMRGADTFVLASLKECLGNSIAEAVLAGLPVVTHSHTASRFILGDQSEWIVDLSQTGTLKNRICELRNDKQASARIKVYQERVAGLFSPKALVPRFYDMCKRLTRRAPSTVREPQLSHTGNASGENS